VVDLVLGQSKQENSSSQSSPTMSSRKQFLFTAFYFFLGIPSFLSNEILRSKVQDLLLDSEKLFSLYSQHVTHHSDELTNLLTEIHQDTFSKRSSSSNRHILTVLTDDQGWGDIGYNDPTFVTPTLDFFANHGIKFDNFYVHVRDPLPSPLPFIFHSPH
jgi:hypothetical protein